MSLQRLGSKPETWFIPGIEDDELGFEKGLAKYGFFRVPSRLNTAVAN